MSAFFNNKDRRVIPNFRSLSQTISLGELDSLKSSGNIRNNPDLTAYSDDFNKFRTLAHASDLLSANISNNFYNNNSANEAAKFILKNEIFATKIQINTSLKYLKENVNPSDDSEVYNVSDFLKQYRKEIIFDKIRNLKFNIKQFGPNPFYFSELGRLFSLIGQEIYAIKNISIAKHLLPTNRYILRSYSRLMAHYGDIDAAHDSLRKNTSTKYDPWLLASEIAFSTLRNKQSNFIKIGISSLTSSKFLPHTLSELASSIGTVELINGNRKKSRMFFENALISPNGNSIAQVEWANNKANLFQFDLTRYSNLNVAEANTLDAYNTQNWDKAVVNAEKWFIDMPFAKRPIMFGHHVSSFFLEDHATAIEFCKAGLIANPEDPLIINNISYSYAMLNDTKTARNFIGSININNIDSKEVKVCLIATSGLIAYKEKKFSEGRQLYLKAMDEAKNNGLSFLYNLALTYLTLEESKINSEFANIFFEQVNKIIDTKNIELIHMKKKITIIRSTSL